MYAEREQRALIERPFLPDEWRRVSSISDWVVRLTPARAQALLDALVETIEAERDEAEDAAGSAHYVVQISTYPVPGELLP
jgi:hypothetical protein